jgi:hypothetical protein
MAPFRRLSLLPVLGVVGVRNRLREALATMATIQLKMMKMESIGYSTPCGLGNC